jgi:hypothetical protein
VCVVHYLVDSMRSMKKERESEMNRAERRRQKRTAEKAEVTYNVKRDQLEWDRKVAQAEIVKPAFGIMLSIAILALRDEFGFGASRIDKFYKAVMLKWEIMHDDFDRIGTDKYNFETFIKVIKDETGFDLYDRLKKDKVI